MKDGRFILWYAGKENQRPRRSLTFGCASVVFSSSVILFAIIWSWCGVSPEGASRLSSFMSYERIARIELVGSTVGIIFGAMGLFARGRKLAILGLILGLLGLYLSLTLMT